MDPIWNHWGTECSLWSFAAKILRGLQYTIPMLYFGPHFENQGKIKIKICVTFYFYL